MDFVMTILWSLLLFFSGTADFEESDIQYNMSENVEVVRVVDGDTIVVLLDGKEQTVRYIGIDTPEPYLYESPECFSREATLRNKELVQSKLIRLGSDIENVDRYGRLLRYIYVDDIFVNEVLVEEGYATHLKIKPNTVHADAFLQLENTAKKTQRGLWGVCR